MRLVSIRASIPSTFFWDGQFYLRLSQPFQWELRVERLESVGGRILHEHVPVLSGHGSVTTRAADLVRRAPHALPATRGVNFRLVVTDPTLLAGADTTPHGRVPYNEFNFPTVQYYCARVPAGPVKRFWRCLWSTSITCNLRYF